MTIAAIMVVLGAFLVAPMAFARPAYQIPDTMTVASLDDVQAAIGETLIQTLADAGFDAYGGGVIFMVDIDGDGLAQTTGYLATFWFTEGEGDDITYDSYVYVVAWPMVKGADPANEGDYLSFFVAPQNEEGVTEFPGGVSEINDATELVAYDEDGNALLDGLGVLPGLVSVDPNDPNDLSSYVPRRGFSVPPPLGPGR